MDEQLQEKLNILDQRVTELERINKTARLIRRLMGLAIILYIAGMAILYSRLISSFSSF